MIVVKNINELNQVYGEKKIQVTIGNFDGVHLGHRKFLTSIFNDCKINHSKMVVISFVPHPSQILRPQNGFLINTSIERRDLLADCGVDYLVEIDFTRDFSTLSPEDFLINYVFSFIGIEKLYLGHDFTFGSNKTGDYKLTAEICQKEKISLFVQDEFRFENHSVSSSVVRSLILTGEMEKVNLLLCRPFFVSGRVIKGQGRGKKIGFPTANLDYGPEMIVPAKGVYVTKTSINNLVFNSVTNIGVNPTFNSATDINIETHLLDFNRDIYGEEIKVSFFKKIRNEIKFSNVNDLVFQIDSDIKTAQNFFSNSASI